MQTNLPNTASKAAPYDLTPSEARAEKFRQTEIYKAGQRMQAIGNLLCDPDTTLAEVVDACEKFSYTFGITLDYTGK